MDYVLILVIFMRSTFETSAAPLVRRGDRLEHAALSLQSSRPARGRHYRNWPDSTYWDSNQNVPKLQNWPTATVTDGETKMSVISDELYMTAYGKDFNLDIYWPATASRQSPAPVAIMVHGGGFQTGDKAQDDDLGSQQAVFGSMGYWCVCINYPLKFDMLKELGNPTARNMAKYWDVSDWSSRVKAWGLTDSGSWQVEEKALYDDLANGNAPQEFRLAQHEAANRAVREAIKYLAQTNDNDNSKAWYKKMDLSRIVCVGGSAGAITCQNTVLKDSSASGLSSYRPTVSLGWSGAMQVVDCAYVSSVSGGAAIFAAHSTLDDKVPIAGDDAMIDQLKACNDDASSSAKRVPYVYITLKDANLHPMFKGGTIVPEALLSATSLDWKRYAADGTSETNGTVAALATWQSTLNNPTASNQLTLQWNYWNTLYDAMFSFAYDNLS